MGKEKDNAGGQALEMQAGEIKRRVEIMWGSDGWPQKRHCPLRGQLILDIL